MSLLAQHLVQRPLLRFVAFTFHARPIIKNSRYNIKPRRPESSSVMIHYKLSFTLLVLHSPPKVKVRGT